jgi:hypothetical protein
VSWRLKEFLLDVKGLDETAFVTRYPHPLLLSEGQGAQGASGKLVGGDSSTRKIGTVEEVAAYADESDDAWVIPVRRKESSQHQTIITIGRGEECDVRLAHPLVSKKHAYFMHDAQGFSLCDADSTNGCFADGNKLEAHKPFRLADSVALRFGPAVKYRFFGSRAFFAFCAMRLKMRDRSGAQAKK